MTEREQQIIDLVCEILHSGVSVDQPVDQDYVCEIIRKKVQEMLS